MSVLTSEQATRFLAPLKGTFTTFLFHDIKAKAMLGRLVLDCASRQPGGATIFDSSAYYSTHAGELAEFADSTELLLPMGEFQPHDLMPLLSAKAPFLVIDDLNSLYSLASDGRRLHQLMVLLRLLSHNARMNGTWVVATAYGTELGKREEKTRSTTAAGDLLVEAVAREGALRLRADFAGWTNKTFEAYFEM